MTPSYLASLRSTEFESWAAEQDPTTPPRELLRRLLARVFDDAGLPARQGRPPYPKMREAATAGGLSLLFPDLGRPRLLSLAAGAAQVFDFWDESHEAAQTAEDQGERRFAPHWHGIAHRREPDAGNAAYWYRRVGASPIFGELARVVADLKRSDSESPVLALVSRGGKWDPYGMIDVCTRSRLDGDDERIALCLQRAEIERLMDATLDAFDVE